MDEGHVAGSRACCFLDNSYVAMGWRREHPRVQHPAAAAANRPPMLTCAPAPHRPVSVHLRPHLSWPVTRLSRPLRPVRSARRSRLGTGAPTSRTFHKRAALWFRGRVLNRRERTAGAEPAASCPAHLDSCRVPSPQEDEGHCCPREPWEGLTALTWRRHIVNPGTRDVCRLETQRGHC